MAADVQVQVQADEYPEKITYKHTAPGKKPAIGEVKDVPAKRVTNLKNVPEGTVGWYVPGGQTLIKVNGPKVDDTIIDKDGVYWSITKVSGGGERWTLLTVKAKEQPKKD